MHLEETLGIVLLASGTSAAATAAGILIISRLGTWAERQGGYFKSFAAGMLVSVSLLHLIPRSLRLHEQAAPFVLAGFLALYLVQRLVTIYGGGRERDNRRVPGRILVAVPLVGIGLHSAVDGLIYAVTFRIDVFTGVLAAIGMILHEFPEGVITYVLLADAGLRRRRAILLALLTAAMTTPLGAAVSVPLVARIGQDTLGRLLAVSAGALLFVGATHLLPEVERERKVGTLLAMMGGAGLALFLVLLRGGV